MDSNYSLPPSSRKQSTYTRTAGVFKKDIANKDFMIKYSTLNEIFS